MVSPDTISELLVTAMWATPLVTGLVQVIKVTLGLENSPRWIPLTAVGVGLAVGLVAVSFSVAGGVVGVILGLGSIGLYEFGKKTIVG